HGVAASLDGGNSRPGSVDPNQRRNAGVELLAVADCIRRDTHHADSLAGLRRGGVHRRSIALPAPRAPLRPHAGADRARAHRCRPLAGASSPQGGWMLSARLATAAVAIPILLWLIFAAPFVVYRGVVLLFTLVALVEYFYMAFPLRSALQRLGIVSG